MVKEKSKDSLLYIQRQKIIIEKMIRLYCHKKEGHNTLCPSCIELLDYASKRLDHCPYGKNKPSCKRCKIHCYQSEMRLKIQKVMRFSGPRMLMYEPIATLKHWFGK